MTATMPETAILRRMAYGERPDGQEAGEEMAWVAVHDSVYGPKLRGLRSALNCSEFEAIGIMTALWIYGRENADRNGFMPNTGRDELERHLYSRASGCSLKPSEIVDALISAGWLDKTVIGFSIHDWDIWQAPWFREKDRKDKDARRKRDQRTTPAEGTQESGEKKKYSSDFERFWETYPRHVEKGAAYKKYNARKKDGYPPEDLLQAAQAYAAECQRRGTEPQYIKQAKTFLGDALPFTDYLKTAEPKPHFRGDNPFAAYIMEDDG